RGGRSRSARLGRGEIPAVARQEAVMSDLALGIDVGTSGVRIAAIDRDERIVAFAEAAMPTAQRDGHRITQDPAVWVRALDDAMARLATTVDLKRVDALAV